jgi:hypothetical protein
MASSLRGFALIIALVAAGCGGDSGVPEMKTVPISGTVTLDGQPMADGELTLNNPPHVQMMIPIAGGKFSGVSPPGKHKVEIRAYKDVTVKNDMYPEGTTSRENYIPPEFNDQSTLTADVTEGGANEFTFDVKSSGGAPAAAPSQ